jgi:hypothetical protein
MGAMKKAGYDFDMMKDQVRELAKEKEALKGEKKKPLTFVFLKPVLVFWVVSRLMRLSILVKALRLRSKGLLRTLKTSRNKAVVDKETRELARMQNQMALGTAKFGMESYERKQDRVAPCARSQST